MSFLKTFVLAIACFSAPRAVTAQVTIDFRLFQSFLCSKLPSASMLPALMLTAQPNPSQVLLLHGAASPHALKGVSLHELLAILLAGHHLLQSLGICHCLSHHRFPLILLLSLLSILPLLSCFLHICTMAVRPAACSTRRACSEVPSGCTSYLTTTCAVRATILRPYFSLYESTACS